MIRVGFVISFTGSGWMGGINYYSNLMHAIASVPSIEPVIITGPNTPESILADFPNIEIIRTRWVDPTKKWMLARRVLEKLFGRAFVLERLLRTHRISVLSHSSHLGPRSRFPTVGWIPDFQHVRLPEFFSGSERKSRDNTFGRLAENCTLVILSSQDAAEDFARFRPSCAHKARVLHFVSGFGAAPGAIEPKETLLARHEIEGPFFFLPNQFWAHKNHAIVGEALHKLRERGRRMTVVMTGNTKDNRHPDHFAKLMERVRDLGVDTDFRVLGLVPYADLAGLMRYSVSLINPSLFEGWSTTVEEAKSLGKAIILSDIPVHREQAPARGYFFEPNNPEHLADQMLRVMDSYSAAADDEQRSEAARTLPSRMRLFASEFERIVHEANGAGQA